MERPMCVADGRCCSGRTQSVRSLTGPQVQESVKEGWCIRKLELGPWNFCCGTERQQRRNLEPLLRAVSEHAYFTHNYALADQAIAQPSQDGYTLLYSHEFACENSVPLLRTPFARRQRLRVSCVSFPVVFTA